MKKDIPKICTILGLPGKLYSIVETFSATSFQNYSYNYSNHNTE